MFTVTSAALDHLASALERLEDQGPDACFRIVPTERGRLTLSVGKPSPQDVEYERDGVTVLAVSEEVRDRCDGRRLDADGTGNLLLR